MRLLRYVNFALLLVQSYDLFRRSDTHFVSSVDLENYWARLQSYCTYMISKVPSCAFRFFSLSTRQTFRLVFHTNVCRYLPLLSVLSVQCQKAISAPWYTRHLLLLNWRSVSSCHSAAKRLYLFTCKSSIYFLSADVTASFWLALTQCWLNVVAIIHDTLPTLNQHCVRVLSCRCSLQK